MLVAEHTNTEYEITKMASHAIWKSLEQSLWYELVVENPTLSFRMMIRERASIAITRNLQRELREYEY